MAVLQTIQSSDAVLFNGDDLYITNTGGVVGANVWVDGDDTLINISSLGEIANSSLYAVLLEDNTSTAEGQNSSIQNAGMISGGMIGIFVFPFSNI